MTTIKDDTAVSRVGSEVLRGRRPSWTVTVAPRARNNEVKPSSDAVTGGNEQLANISMRPRGRCVEVEPCVDEIPLFPPVTLLKVVLMLKRKQINTQWLKID